MTRLIITLWVLCLLTGCSVASDQAVFESVQAEVRGRSGFDIARLHSAEDETAISQKVKELLSAELTPTSAVQIALLNNRGLQATFEELGIARAGVLEAVTLPNPLGSVSARFPSGGGRTNVEFGITESLLSLVTMPLARSMAENELEATKARVGDAALSLSAEVQQRVVDLQAAMQDHDLLSSVAKASEASFIASQKIHDAGNNTVLDLKNDRILFEQTKLDLARSETDIREIRANLNALLGLWEDDTSWKVAQRLPEPKNLDLSLAENKALLNRLDLRSARAEVAAAAQVLGIALPMAVLNESELGTTSERDTDGSWVTGPHIALSIPVFNQGQASNAEALARYRAALFRYYDLAVRIRAETRASRDRLISQKQQVEFIREVLIPLRHSIVQETQLRYNGMLLGVFSLLAAKQQEIEAGRQYIAALRDYWKAYVALERAMGCSLSQSGALCVTAATPEGAQSSGEGHEGT